MTLPTASLTTLLIQKETSLGVEAGNVATLRVTSESLVPAVSTIASEEIDGTRNVADLNKVSAMGEGEIELEFKDDHPTDSLLASLLGTSAIAVEDGFTDNTDYFNGNTQTSFTIEKKTSDGTNNLFQKYDGMVPTTLELTAESGSFVSGTIGFMGAGVNTMTTTASLSATDAASETVPFTTVDANTIVKFDTDRTDNNSGAGGVSVLETDYDEISTVKTTSFSMSIDNGARAQTQIGSTDLAGIGTGRFTVTGSLTVYATDKTLFDNYINTTAFGMLIQVGSTTPATTYRFYLPEVKITSAQVLAGGNDEDVLMEIEWQAVKTNITGVNSNNPFTMKFVKNEV